MYSKPRIGFEAIDGLRIRCAVEVLELRQESAACLIRKSLIERIKISSFRAAGVLRKRRLDSAILFTRRAAGRLGAVDGRARSS